MSILLQKRRVMSGDTMLEMVNREAAKLKAVIMRARYQFEGTGINSIPLIKTSFLLIDKPGVEFDWGAGITAVRLDIEDSLIFYTKVKAGGGNSPYRQDSDKWIILIEGDAVDPGIGELIRYEPVLIPEGVSSSILTEDGCTLLVIMHRD